MKGSRCEKFSRLVPATCSRDLFPRLVLAFFSCGLFPRLVLARCARGLFPRLVPAPCSRDLFSRFVPATCSRDLFPRLVLAICSRGSFPRFVPATCKRNPTQPNEAMRPNATQRNQMKPTVTKYKKCDQARLIFSGSLQPPEKMLGVPNCEMFRMPHVEGSRVYQVSSMKYQVVVVKTL